MDEPEHVRVLQNFVQCNPRAEPIVKDCICQRQLQPQLLFPAPFAAHKVGLKEDVAMCINVRLVVPLEPESIEYRQPEKTEIQPPVPHSWVENKSAQFHLGPNHSASGGRIEKRCLIPKYQASSPPGSCFQVPLAALVSQSCA